jgi:hypothetical protein
MQSSGTSRYADPVPRSVFKAERTIGSFEQNLIRAEPYPYQNIYYISASSENEIAKDIQHDLLHLYPTIDGKPHGALTDSLLRVLAGEVQIDTDNDGVWSQLELYTALRSLVRQRFNQTPQALPKQGQMAADLRARAFFVRSTGGLAPPTDTPATSQPSLRVQIVDSLPVIKAHIAKIDGVVIVNDKPDLIISKDGNALVLALPDMHPLSRFTAFDIHQVADRIRRHQRIEPLTRLVYPRQRFNVEIDLSGSYRKSVIMEDEPFGFEIRAEKPAYLLLLNVDPAGAVHILYPFDRSELQPLVPGKTHILADRCQALWPFGTETVKLFAFTHKPEALESLVGQESIDPDSALFKELERLVGLGGVKSAQASVRSDAAQALLRLTSYPKTRAYP